MATETIQKLQRKPDTPLQNFFTTGKYEKNLNVRRHVLRNAEPGLSLDIARRNPHHSQDINIKPITSINMALDKSHYNPKSYLSPFEAKLKAEFNPNATFQGSRTQLMGSGSMFATTGKHTRNLSKDILDNQLLIRSVKVEH